MTSAVRQGFATAQHSAVHLEMRDSYMTDDPVFIAWQQGRPFDPAEEYRSWSDLTREVTGRGVVVRRARIVSEPVSDYIRWEHSLTAAHNIAAGEEVRWLPRHRTTDLALPGVDFWLFDGTTVVFNHFTGDGQWADLGMETVTEPAVAKLCSTAFEAVWERAIPHAQYVI
ncbi:DUF6879 family protein [Streptomyces sp. NPDC001816]|uniref:DUF6879 family protein n=1 Tax=Streptomyces sp. NPDC001816 TaxID=3364612 RepID=UPI0036ADE621